MRVSVDLPNDFVEMLTSHEIEREMRTTYALALFKDSRVSLSKAADLAGMDIYGFMSACKANQIPVIDLSREDLLNEVDSLQRT